MGDAKRLVVQPISSRDARRIISSLHYSGKFTTNSQLHFGVFLDGKCGGAMSFGPCMDKKKLIGLVRNTKWNGFMELNRMAFADWLPRNGESRCIAYAMRFIKKRYPHVEWVVSFADASQCGDGTIYRASGFVLTQINKNRTLLRFPDGEVVANLSLTNGGAQGGASAVKKRLCEKWGIPMFSGAQIKPFTDIGARFIPGYQLRYVYFLNPDARSRLTCPEIPFERIAEVGASMYRGERPSAGSAESGTSDVQSEGGGATPTPALSSGVSGE